MRLQRTTRPLKPCHNLHWHFLPIITNERDHLARIKVPPLYPQILALQALCVRLEQLKRNFTFLLYAGGNEAGFKENHIPTTCTAFTAVVEGPVLEDIDEPWRLLHCRHSPPCKDDKFILVHQFLRRNHTCTHQPSLPPLQTDNISSAAHMTHDGQRCLLAAGERLVRIVGIHVVYMSIFAGVLLG